MKAILFTIFVIILADKAFPQAEPKIKIAGAEANFSRSTVDRMGLNINLAENYVISSKTKELLSKSDDQRKVCKKGQALMDLLKFDLDDAEKFSAEDKRLLNAKVAEFKKRYTDYNEYFNRCIAELNAQSPAASESKAPAVSK